jgi:acyl carrier protein
VEKHGGEMELSEITERITKIVRNLLDPDQAYTAMEDDFILGDEGDFDSVLALRLVVELEKEFTIAVDDEDVVPQNFRDLPSLAVFVARKLSRLQSHVD